MNEEYFLEEYKEAKEDLKALYSHNDDLQIIADFLGKKCKLKRGDEVNLHSRLLESFLNPKGKHKQGDKFLKLFLNIVCKKIGSSNWFDAPLGSLQVARETNRMDILILDTDKKKAILIENKIWAEDQTKQIARYINKLINNKKYKCNREDILAIYLSPSDKYIPNGHCLYIDGNDKEWMYLKGKDE